MGQIKHRSSDIDRYLPGSPLMTSPETAKALGFKTASALTKARQAGRLPVPMFTLPGRRGWFASTESVRAWLESTLQPRKEDSGMT